jgi:chromosome segregation protein
MEARAEIEQELKLLQREYFGKTFWLLKEQVDAYQGQIDALAKTRVSAENRQKQLRDQAENLEKGNHGQLDKYREIQQHLEYLQKQKNKMLEELSLVRGKMQSQKTASAGDPQTLQVEIHTLAKKIEEIKEQIEKTIREQTEFKVQVENQKKLLTEIKSKLGELYSQAQGGMAQMDWQNFEQGFFGLETIVNEFFQSLEQGRPWEEVQGVVLNLKQKFSKFKEVVKLSVLDPRRINQVQQQIAEMQNQKEELDQAMQNLQLGLSKTEIYLNFLHKDQESLEQQKLHLDLELRKAVSHSMDDFLKDLLEEEVRLKGQVDGLAKEILSIEMLFKKQQGEQSDLQKNLHQIELSLRDQQDELSKIKDKISVLSVEKAKYDTQMEVLAEEVRRILGEAVLADIGESKIESRTTDLEGRIQRLKNQLDMIGGMDELTLKEYQETEARYTNLSAQVEDLRKSMQDLRNIIDELDEHIKVKFNEAFHRINEKFEQYFRILFNGGRAHLSVIRNEEQKEETEAAETGEAAETSVDSLRPEEKIVAKYEKGVSNIVGIDIKATPPGKKLSAIQALSGGERSLTSIALLCSLLTCFPSPFVVLDEVDAALDDANTIRFGQILGTLANQTQFLTITHNRETMSQANILYGVTMGDDGVSKLLSVKLEQAKAFAK